MTSLTAACLALGFAVNLATFVLSQNEQICLSLQRGALAPPQGRGQNEQSERRGIPGPRGRKGMKGNPGPPGRCKCDLSEVVELRKTFDRLQEKFCFAGVKSGKVRDDEMTASSFYDQNMAASEGRLDSSGRIGNFWTPYHSRWETPGEWLQVDLRTPARVTGVVTQGGASWWVKSFKISFGNSTEQLQVIQDVDGNDVIFPGNTDLNSHVQNMFPKPIEARYFRLIVLTFRAVIELRLEYLTC
ncbi:lactadherin-like [Clavelina lepadiformis]|uniref:lactadherin-like n=1 Tax=Clavelina lepadiformis TaxID=159417 RepID=UPI0040415D0E